MRGSYKQTMRVEPPSWDYTRPYLTHSLDRHPSPTTTTTTPSSHPTLSSYPPELQESLALDDILTTLMGVTGTFTHYLTHTPHTTNPSESLLKLLIPLATDYIIIRGFIEETRSANEGGGYIRQALGVALQEVVEEYLEQVVEWEKLFRKGELGLQRLVWRGRPWLRRMRVLRRVVVKVGHARGAMILEIVQQDYERHRSLNNSNDDKGGGGGGGDGKESSDGRYLKRIVKKVQEPLYRMIKVWLREGKILDPWDEFFVVQNPKYRKLSFEDYDKDPLLDYWNECYVVNQDMVPTLLGPYVEKILRAGKYLNVLRECQVDWRNEDGKVGRNVDGDDDVDTGKGKDDDRNRNNPWAMDEKDLGDDVDDDNNDDGVLGVDAARKLGRYVNEAYENAAARLIKYMKNEAQLMKRLRFLKKFFLLQQGDFLVTFLDAADSELAKNRKKISLSKLRSLLGLCIKTSGAAGDQFSDELSCELLNFDLTSQLLVLMDKGRDGTMFDNQQGWDAAKKKDKVLTGYDVFALDYHVQWPLSLIVSRMAILKYQMLFRYIFHCKHVECEIGSCWQNSIRQENRKNRLRPLFAHAYILRHRMLQFLSNILYYTVADVLEPNWQKFETDIQKTNTLDEIMDYHMDFLDNSLTQCVFSNEVYLKTFHSVTQVCLLFATYIKKIADEITKDMIVEDIELLLEDREYEKTIEKFEKAFHGNIQKVLEALSQMSKRRVDTHLANLCDRLDYTGYYEQQAAFGR